MRLEEIYIRDFRSIFPDGSSTGLTLSLAPGMNTLVGLNNCGKSNVLRAVSLALDPNHPFAPEVDAPGPTPFSLPTIRLTFGNEDSGTLEQLAFDAAANYEHGLGVAASASHADAGKLTLEVAFQQEHDGFRRRERIIAANNATPSLPEDHDRLELALERLRESIRFVLISSGESISSVLEGNFREILHSVVQERLDDAFSQAESSRQEYVDGLKESLLGPLRDRLSQDVSGLFPEIETTQLTPDVPSIERTLSNVGIDLGDLVETPLDQKGTGVRGGVLVAMLSYLALNATRSMVFAVEEPEAFLHPASQEDLRDLLEGVATTAGVNLLVTTHSPYIATKSGDGQLIWLTKDASGRTRIAQTAAGSAAHAPLIGGLFRESTMADMLASATAYPEETEAILLVEGDGDEKCLRLAADIVGRPDLLIGLDIRPSGGTNRMAVEAVVTRASTDLPMMVLVDNDNHGIELQKLLCGQKFRFQKGKQVLTYAEVFPKDERDFPYEAEDLFRPSLMQSFIDSKDTPVHEGSRLRPDGAFHYDIGQAGKHDLDDYLSEHTTAEDVLRWVELILLLRTRLGLANPEESAADLVGAAAHSVESGESSELVGSALILVDRLAVGRWQVSNGLLLHPDEPVPGDLTHVGFYSDGEILASVPAVVADYPALLLAPETVRQLRTTGRSTDSQAAQFIESALEQDTSVQGQTRRVLLLSAPHSDNTHALPAPIKNTKQKSGRPLAWAVAPRVVALASLLAGPNTTDELDELESGHE